jgi:hypothetical protein
MSAINKSTGSAFDMNDPARFIHENRPLRDWLLQLVDQDASRRKAAAKIVTDRFYMPVERLPETSALMEEFLGRFNDEVRRAVNQPDFPAANFVRNILSLKLALHESWSEMNARQFQQEEEIDRAERAKLEADPSEAAKKRYVSRLFIRTARDCQRISAEEPHELLTTGAALAWVIESLGQELLPAADILRGLMGHRVESHLAYDAIRRMGPAGLVFYDDLLEKVKREKANYRVSQALGALLRGAPERVLEILELAKSPDAEVRINATNALGGIGREVAARYPQVETELRRRLAEGAKDGDWYALVEALGAIAKTTATVDFLLGFIGQADKQGPVILALGEIGREPDKVLPRLIELLDTFEEYDPDLSYHGEHERVVQALRGFGPAAAVAVPALIRHIRTGPAPSEPDEEVIRFLGELGPLAKAALPALLEVRAKETSLEDDSYLGEAIKKIQQT